MKIKSSQLNINKSNSKTRTHSADIDNNKNIYRYDKRKNDHNVEESAKLLMKKLNPEKERNRKYKKNNKM